ncbi:N-acetyl-gamma-glutamyl-phosphate reductase [Mangrovivirga sp. M17]|uniref:N-acetyl-gamma-glutamyl-phosphate reductase n=1 Tax=Mangrovivirga halotolerans TaxID=2993936 RepID=A0ABT3RPQ8_9BACT|nr:N-acetyl-gamma-glutamyl-phosphate reductase [Mangrovivirga halotolerans]MCX2743577.1 N-acetyl-gamma-glutamyl-phosphate reductase [Mangrovivirga halotolerans]
MLKTGIIGGAGYTAGELIRLLINHPEVEIKFIHSNSQAGKPVYSIHQDLIGEIDINFTNELSNDVDLVFLCMGHGASEKFLKEKGLSENIKIVDLSRDFRLKPDNSWNGKEFVYGLPEKNKHLIKEADAIANPGCFATAIQLALLPAASVGAFKEEEAHVHAVTGSTGAGQKPTNTSHFSWRNNNISVYKAFTHQHLGEIEQQMNEVQGQEVKGINFVPMRGDFTRGIFATVYFKSDMSEEEAQELYENFYADAAFTHVSKEPVHLKQVVNSNKGVIKVEKHGDKIMVTSMIDNLLKGASGQAVQNMNLMMGWPEKLGLGLKPVSF